MFTPLKLACRQAVLIAALAATLASVQGQECKRLTDDGNTFVNSVSTFLTAQGTSASNSDWLLADPTFYAPIDKLAPEFSQCLAQLDPAAVYASLAQSENVQKCGAALSATASGASYIGRTSAGQQVAPGQPQTGFRDHVCPTYGDFYYECVTELVVPVIEQLFASSNGCCDPFQALIQTALGDTLTNTIAAAVGHLGDSICATRTTKSDPRVVACGDSIYDNYITYAITAMVQAQASNEDSSVAVFKALAPGLQIPNDQACKAIHSQEFTTTTGVATAYGYADVKPVDKCFTPIDKFAQFIRGWPMWDSELMVGASTVQLASNLFDAGKCESGDAFVKWVVSEDAPIMKVAHVLDDMEARVDQWNIDHSQQTAQESGEEKTGVILTVQDAVECLGQGPLLQNDCLVSLSGGKQARRLQSEQPKTAVEQVQAFATPLAAFLGNVCFHFPNKVSCPFPDENINEIYFPTRVEPCPRLRSRRY